MIELLDPKINKRGRTTEGRWVSINPQTRERRKLIKKGKKGEKRYQNWN